MIYLKAKEERIQSFSGEKSIYSKEEWKKATVVNPDGERSHGEVHYNE